MVEDELLQDGAAENHKTTSRKYNNGDMKKPQVSLGHTYLTTVNSPFKAMLIAGVRLSLSRWSHGDEGMSAVHLGQNR